MTAEIVRQVVEEGAVDGEVPTCCAECMATIRVGAPMVLKCRSCSRHWRTVTGDISNLVWIPISKSEYDDVMRGITRSLLNAQKRFGGI